ncbi:hypothetical protein P4H71_05160 [Paenibacillus kribbensis]|uniref:hypothetical protein n=1 Tax=Paenibacillus kribbensis TaxID=172713 RepID=UPI002DBF9860|nr:hypothetical protein [Paenibacillus kribbensis]MEC0233745.1 hypothetical protein [Paenibacillus kribbensis]
MTQRLEIFYRDECNAEAINTGETADECRIIVPKHVKLTIDFLLDSETVNTPVISIEEINEDNRRIRVVYNETLSNESGSRTDQAYVPESNEDKKYLLKITNFNENAWRLKCKEKSRNDYELRFDDTYRDEDYDDITAHLKFIPTPLNDKDIILLRSRKGTFINTAHGIGPSVQMISEANYDPHISDEAWRIERSEGSGPLMHGDGIFLRTRSRHYLNTDHGMGPNVKVVPEANFDTHISDEVWIIERPSGRGPVNYGDAVFIKTRKNYYLNTNGEADSPVNVVTEPNTEICHSDEIWFLD